MLNTNLKKDIQCKCQKKKDKTLQNITQETLHKTWGWGQVPPKDKQFQVHW